MKELKNTLEEPRLGYGGKRVSASSVQFAPMEDMMASLKARGYISHDELVDKVSKHM